MNFGDQKKIIFLDRDGVINQDSGYVSNINDFNFLEGIFELCQYFLGLNYEIIVVTNQSGIGRGYFTEQEFKTLNNWMLSQLVENSVQILEVFYCPHSPNDKCNCRKPRPGMFLEAIDKYNIDKKRSWMIGDKSSDIEAANSAGIENCIFLGDKNVDTLAEYIVNDIEEIKTIIKD